MKHKQQYLFDKNLNEFYQPTDTWWKNGTYVGEEWLAWYTSSHYFCKITSKSVIIEKN